MEIVVVTAILSSVTLAFLGTFTTVSKFHEKNMKAIKAGLLAEEGIEALRIIKSQDFNELTSLIVPPADFSDHKYLEVSTSTWGVTTTPEVIDGLYYRYFVLRSAFRDANSDLTSSAGGSIDPNTFYAEVYVEWLWRNATNTNVYNAFFTNI